MTWTPKDRARRAFLEMPDNPSENDFLEVVTAAVQAERNAGDLRREEVQAALQAALEDLAKARLAHVASLNELSRTAAELDEAKKLRDRFQIQHLTGDAQLSECRESATKIADDLAKAKQELSCAKLRALSAEGLASWPSAASRIADLERERDGLAAALVESQKLAKECKTVSIYSTKAILATHDRAVAARVLRKEAEGHFKDEVFGWHISSATVGKELRRLAAQYEAGEREVPNA